jgi:histidinol-phosphate aminotransferase
VRAAYAIAPVHAHATAMALDAMAPSWVLGAHGLALLHSWAQADTQAWVAQSLGTLRHWMGYQTAALEGLGWGVMPSHAHFVCARPPEGCDLPGTLAALRSQGIQLRDATSFGLPGWARLSVLPPQAVDALRQTLLARGVV